MNTLTNTTLFFYKGTTFPIIHNDLNFDNIYNTSNLMIKKGLEANYSIKQQINIYVEQLDKIENELVLNNFKNISSKLNMNENEISTMWMLNITALIKMKHLKDDEMNGFVTIK